MEPMVQTGCFNKETAEDFIMGITYAAMEQAFEMLSDYGVSIKKGMMRMMKKLLITLLVCVGCSVVQPVVLA